MSTPPIDREPIESYEVTGKRTKELTRRQIKKARITGIVMFALAAIVMFFWHLLQPELQHLG